MLRAAVFLSLAAAVILGVAACTPSVPDEDPSIRGTVTVRTPSSDGGQLLVEAGSGSRFEYDKASVRITKDTPILRSAGAGSYKKATFDDLTEGTTVDVWFTGAVAESYPVQATAAVVLILD